MAALAATKKDHDDDDDLDDLILEVVSSISPVFESNSMAPAGKGERERERERDTYIPRETVKLGHFIHMDEIDHAGVPSSSLPLAPLPCC